MHIYIRNIYVIYSDIFLIYDLEHRMEGDGVEPNEFILASVMDACAKRSFIFFFFITLEPRVE